MPSAQPQLYDYFFDDEKMEWIAWSLLVPKYIHDPERKFIDILVPTLDTVRATWLLNLQVHLNLKHVYRVIQSSVH